MHFGVDKNRVRILENTKGSEKVLEAMSSCDIYLDTFPYSGGISIFDPISLGLPIVTMEHRLFRGQMASAIIKYTQYESKVTSTIDEYIKRAVKLANEPLFYKNELERIHQSNSAGNTEFDENFSTAFQEAILQKCQK